MTHTQPSPTRALFPQTRWSVVLHATLRHSPASATALEALCRAYWYPLYAYARRCGQSPPDAEVYLLDIDALRPGELDTLAKHVAAKFSVPYEIVLSEMRDCGVPILAEDCSCAMDLRMFI